MITDSYPDQLKALFIQHGVILAYLFGSQAEGRARPSSDVDVAVLLPHETPRVEYSEIQLKLIGDLQDILHRNDVDVVILNHATALLAREVVKRGKILYEDEITHPAVDFIVRTMKYYADTEHFRRLSLMYLSREIETYRQQREESKVQRYQNG